MATTHSHKSIMITLRVKPIRPLSQRKKLNGGAAVAEAIDIDSEQLLLRAEVDNERRRKASLRRCL